MSLARTVGPIVKPTQEISFAEERREVIAAKFLTPDASKRVNPGTNPQTTAFLAGDRVTGLVGSVMGEDVGLLICTARRTSSAFK